MDISIGQLLVGLEHLATASDDSLLHYLPDILRLCLITGHSGWLATGDVLGIEATLPEGIFKSSANHQTSTLKLARN
jgi:hypothetical protein